MEKTGKPGTFAVEDFETLKTLVTSYGPEVVAKKVAKACLNKSKALSHEYAGSAVAKAYAATASRVTSILPGTSTAIPGSAFSSLGQLVGKYGAELVIIKTAKLSKKTNASLASKLSTIFPST